MGHGWGGGGGGGGGGGALAAGEAWRLATVEPLPALYAMAALYLVTAALHLVVPSGPPAAGYARDAAGRPLRYRLNGGRAAAVLLASAALWVRGGVVRAPWLWERWGACALGGGILGLAGSIFFYVLGPPPYPHASAPKVRREHRRRREAGGDAGAGLAARLHDFYYGFELSPRPAPLWDTKMWLYQAGAAALLLLVLSAAAAQHEARGALTPAMATYAGLMAFFVVDYLLHERAHLFTYDLVSENVGFKLVFGCLCFYPFFYPVGALPLVARAPEHEPAAAWLVAAAAVFAAGWTLSRGANAQKHAFKTRPRRRVVLGCVRQRSIGRGRLLVSGFWGVARHVNYLGEVLMAVGLALPGGLAGPRAWVPWLYPLYYVALLVPRQRDDDAEMRAKVGDRLWRAYTARVPYRIVPWLY